MAHAVVNTATQRCAVVTGANKGIGFEICRQLACKGITVVLTSRNEKRGIEAVERLKEFGVSDNVVFHQLDVLDPATVDALVDFIRTRFGKLDILVNNAGISGLELIGDGSIFQELIESDVDSAFGDGKQQSVELKAKGTLLQSYNDAEECIQTNYYGAKRVTKALIPLLQLSDSPRIVNVSSLLGNLRLMSNEWAKGVLTDEEGLTEERIDKVVEEFLKNFKEGSLEANHWPTYFSAYKVSKSALNAYTRCTTKKYPSNFCINCLCPGFTKTDITFNVGPLSTEEAADSVVELAVLPEGGPSGCFYYRKGQHDF